jgi:Calcineurin-like phosphoesterase
MSDLHLEFGDLVLPGGDNLILAGDIFITEALRGVSRMNDLRRRSIRFATQELSKYKHVLHISGNHEHYNGIIDDGADIMDRFFAEYAPHARHLDNEAVIIDGTMFIGTTLWATYGVGTRNERAIQMQMNDFVKIQTRKSMDGVAAIHESLLRQIYPSDLNKLHYEAVAFLKEHLALAKETTDRPCVVITHHVPTERSKGCAGGSHGDRITKDGYYAQLDDLIESNPHIGVWISGHTHDPVDYHIGPTRMISNPRGYAKMEAIAQRFNPRSGDFQI